MRRHTAQGLAFIGVCVAIGLAIFLAVNIDWRTHDSLPGNVSNASTPADNTMTDLNTVETMEAAPPANSPPPPDAKPINLSLSDLGGVKKSMPFKYANTALGNVGWKYLTDTGPVDRGYREYLYQRGDSFLEVDLDDDASSCSISGIQGYDHAPDVFLDGDGKLLDQGEGTGRCDDDNGDAPTASNTSNSN